jgi:serine/threonine protein kinase
MVERHSQAYVRELIVWSHSSHPHVLPFYGVFLDDAQQICLASPFMKNGNLQDYAPRLPQKSRVPFVRSLISLVAPNCSYTITTHRRKLLDAIKGLDYLHRLGIIHSDLKAVSPTDKWHFSSY